ncbi:MAG TPA: heterodisulfide reductase-related iron-sulfur binding cluster, partial [Dehalococcoidales bacterium]|nr:heterodisulfide reductase-related iron-sulfur binding cluster [Dehalococcoidales bacterium]
MDPSRIVFWDVKIHWPFYVIAALATALLIWAIYRHILRWKVGRPAYRANHWGARIADHIRVLFTDFLLHRKFVGAERPIRKREIYPGIMHFLIAWGMIILFIGTVIDASSHYIYEYNYGTFYLWYSVITDSFGILLVIGVLMAVFRRYLMRPKRLDNKIDDAYILVLLLVIAISGFIIEGLRIADIELVSHPGWAVWSPGGYVFAKAFFGASATTLQSWYLGLWWFHAILVFGTFTYVALFNSKLFHILWDILNWFFRNLGPKGALVKLDFEKSELFGAGKIEDFTWKQLMDLDACTRCGRCQDACPAYFSGKKLNPKMIIQDLKTHMYEVYPKIASLKPAEKRKEMVGEAITDEVLWDCTTCRACMQACPVYIEHVDKIVDMRRNLAMEKTRFPEEVQETLKCLGTRGHPYRGTTSTRTTWYEKLDVKTAAEAPDFDVLYWVGCSAALDDRNIKVAQATVKILKAAGVKFAVLGEEESCCGDPARRMGDEYLFQTLCQQNIEIFKSHNVKKIIATCPHCFNNLKFEYPQFGGNYEVIHHSQFIAGLVKDGKLKLNKKVLQKAAYHDSCYLGRYNDIYNEPRSIVKALCEKPVELERWGTNSFCCGGGGGHMWMEEDPDKRVNNRRVDDVLKSGVDCVATACPYCLTMMEDGIK